MQYESQLNQPIKQNIRAFEIDGIRGWAALSVLLFHVFQEMLGDLLPALHTNWLAPFMNGGFAVSVFFILSGDALTVAFFSKHATSPVAIDRLLVRRYTRLAIPVFLSCLSVYLLRQCNLDFHTAATLVNHREDWLGNFIPFEFSLISLIKYSFIEVFTNHSTATSYNPFLWTMSVEMVGSMLVFLTCFAWPRLRLPSRLLVYLSIGLMLLGSNLSLFFAGMWLGYLRSQSYFFNIQQQQDTHWRYLPIFGYFVVFAGLYFTYGMHVPRHLNIVLAFIFVFSVYASPRSKLFFQTSFSKWLGEISFPLYLMHFPIIISFMSWALIEWSHHTWMNSDGVLLGIGLITVLMALLVAFLFGKIERFLLKRVDKVILKVLL